MMSLGAQLVIFTVWWVLKFFVFLGDTRTTFDYMCRCINLRILGLDIRFRHLCKGRN